MKRYFFYAFLLLVFACKGKADADQSTISEGKDSAVPPAKQMLNPGDAVSAEGYSTFYAVDRVVAAKNFNFSIQARYEKPDTVEIKGQYDSSKYFKARYLIVRDQAAKVADTMDLGDMSDWDLKLEDMTDSLKFKSPLVKLEYHGDSDQPTSHFIEYKDGKLKLLFEILWLESLERKDDNTLSGVVRYTDEIVYGKIDMPVTISLRNGEVTEHVPDVQYIGNTSKTLVALKTYRALNGNKLSEPYIIKKGTPLIIDTFYRKKGLVRLMVSDSIPVYIRKDSLDHEKIVVNTAG